ncbi:MAG TPA: hypothetical protein VHB79_36780 [Polyangiaceae bacterium]|nr:hypothetical protein [Polyangiaceae bacterium]
MSGSSSAAGNTLTGGNAAGGTAGSGAGNVSGGAGGGDAGGAATGGGGASGENGGSGGAGNGEDRAQRKLLLRDEGNSAIHYVDLADSSKNWHQTVPVGKDLQLIGGKHFLIGTENGYQERNLSDGTLVKDVNTFAGTLDAHRLHNGNTLLTGVDFHGGKGIVLLEVTPQGTAGRQIEFPGTYVRLARESGPDRFLITSNTHVFEGDAQGKVLWDATIVGGPADPHAWEALRIASGDVLVAAGYAAGLEIFGPDQKLKQTITGGDGVEPYFFSDVQIMPGGTYVVANWEGHGTGNGAKGLQVVEYDTSGKLVWSWKQDASFVSSLQGVIVLSGVDQDKLEVESPTTGVLEPVN